MTMPKAPDIPQERLARNPLITDHGYARLRAILDHPAAPVWNYEVGDRVRNEDLGEVTTLAALLRQKRDLRQNRPSGHILTWIKAMRPVVQLFQAALPEGFCLERDWRYIPTMGREDVALRLEEIVPLDADLSRLIVYDTSGVTGHAILVPQHPRAMAQYHALLEYILEQYGIRFSFSADITACLNVGCQVSTVTFANTFSVWNQAGFAKVNLHERVWDREKAQLFFDDTAPLFLTGDPLGFSQMEAWGIDARPAAMISTAVALTSELKAALQARYDCPVIDLYSTTETGPIAFTDPTGDGMRIFPPDLYVEVVDDQGKPLPEGEPGEICVTGGRNPFLPLLRYRTGDYGRIVWSGRELPCLLDLQAREPVSFLADDCAVISMVDVARIIREWPLVQHEFVQHPDLSCELTIQPLTGYPVDVECLKEKLGDLFGRSIQIMVKLDNRLGEDRPGGKVIPFSSRVAAAHPEPGRPQPRMPV